MAAVPGVCRRGGTYCDAYYWADHLPSHVFFFIAEGFHYTRDRKKYALRLFMLAVVSHFAYMLASNSYADWHSFIPFYYGDVLNQTSVVWSLLGGLLMLWLCEDEKRSMGVKVAGVLLIFA